MRFFVDNLIFCHNVNIFFSPAHAKRTLKLIYERTEIFIKILVDPHNLKFDINNYS